MPSSEPSNPWNHWPLHPQDHAHIEHTKTLQGLDNVTHGKASYFNVCLRFILGLRSKSNTFKQIERMVHKMRENLWNQGYHSWVQWVDLGALVAVQLSASILQSSHIKYGSLQVTMRTSDCYGKLVTREIWVSYQVGDISVTVTTKGFHILVFYTPSCVAQHKAQQCRSSLTLYKAWVVIELVERSVAN